MVMAGNQVILYFDKQEDALLFTLAASSVIGDEESMRDQQAAAKVAKEICKVNRITTEGVLNKATLPENSGSQAAERSA
jgi:hypothetical protein